MNFKLTLAFTLSLAGAQAIEAEPLSRAGAVQIALGSNTDVLKSRQDLSLLHGRVGEALADALPELTFAGSATRYRDPSLLNSSAFDSFPPELRDALKPVPANVFEGALQVRQTVWSFKVGKALRAAHSAEALGREAVRRAEQVTSLATIRAYNTLLLSIEKVKVAENSVKQKEEHLAMAQNRRAAGVATDLDVLRSRVDLENQKAQLERLRGESELAGAALNAVMLRRIDAVVEPSDTLAYQPFEASLDQVFEQAIVNRPEVKSAVLTEDLYSQFVGVARADARPRVDFSASWGYSVRKPENFFNSDFQRWSAGITVTVPIFDGNRTGSKVEQTVAERQKARLDKVAIESQILLEAKDALDRLQVASRVLAASEMNVVQAQRALEMTQANYKHGAATTLDVMDAQTALTLAESLRLEALYDHANARAAVRYVMGRSPLDEPVSSPQTQDDKGVVK